MVRRMPLRILRDGGAVLFVVVVAELFPRWTVSRVREGGPQKWFKIWLQSWVGAFRFEIRKKKLQKMCHKYVEVRKRFNAKIQVSMPVVWYWFIMM